MATRRKENTFKSQRELKVKTNKLPKAREMQATNSWFVLVLHLIGGESGASFLIQPRNEVKKPTNPRIIFYIQ